MRLISAMPPSPLRDEFVAEFEAKSRITLHVQKLMVPVSVGILILRNAQDDSAPFKAGN